jgi:hypothetical protein
MSLDLFLDRDTNESAVSKVYISAAALLVPSTLAGITVLLPVRATKPVLVGGYTGWTPIFCDMPFLH